LRPAAALPPFKNLDAGARVYEFAEKAHFKWAQRFFAAPLMFFLPEVKLKIIWQLVLTKGQERFAEIHIFNQFIKFRILPQEEAA